MVRIYSNFLLILALAFSAMAPKGYMPNFSDNGFSITICAGGVFEERVVDKDHPNYENLRLIYEDKSQSHDRDMMQNDCAYSFFNVADYSPIYISVDAIIQIVSNGVAALSFLDILRSSGMPPPSTGPPSLNRY